MSKLTTISKQEANILNYKNKNLFYPGGYIDYTNTSDRLLRGYTDSNLPLSFAPLQDYPTPNYNIYNNVPVATNLQTSWNPSINGLSVRQITQSPNFNIQQALLNIDTLSLWNQLSKSKISGSAIANKALGAASGIMLIGQQAVELAGKLLRDNAKQLINSLIALLNSTLLDLSSNKNLLNSISGATTINMFNKNDFLSNKGQAAKGIIGAGLSGATTGLSVGGPLGALIMGIAGLGSGIAGRLIGRKKAIKTANEMNAKATEANALLNQRINEAVLQLNLLHAQVSASNIQAYGGNLNEGDELELTKDLIEELEKLGYKLEY